MQVDWYAYFGRIDDPLGSSGLIEGVVNDSRLPWMALSCHAGVIGWTLVVFLARVMSTTVVTVSRVTST